MSQHRKPGSITRYTVKNLFAKPATISYPGAENEPKVEKAYRGRLVYRPENCVNCTLCMKDCPTGALKIINDGTREAKKMRAELDLSRCIFCCQCVDSCRRGCLGFTQEINLSADQKSSLLIDPKADGAPAEPAAGAAPEKGKEA